MVGESGGAVADMADATVAELHPVKAEPLWSRTEEDDEAHEMDVEDPRPVEFKNGKPSFDLHYTPE